MLIELIDLVLGVIFGYFHKGKEHYAGIIGYGAIVGIVVGIALSIVSVYLLPGSMSINVAFLGMMGFFVEIILFVIIFIIGAFIGDQMEKIRNR